MTFFRFQVGDKVIWKPNEICYLGIVIKQAQDFKDGLRVLIKVNRMECPVLERDLTLIPTAIDKLDEIL